MTGVPEVVFARELGLCYAAICLVSNTAAGLEPEHVVTNEEVTQIMATRRADLLRLLECTARGLGEERECACGGPE